MNTKPSKTKNSYTSGSRPHRSTPPRKPSKVLLYQVVDTLTEQVKGTYLTKKRARHERDKLDDKAGAIRHSVNITEV